MAAQRRISLWVWIAGGAGLLAVLAGAGLVGLRAWIKTDDGRRMLVELIDGRQVGPLGTIRIRGLEGDPLSSMTLDELIFVDMKGEWLRARDITLEWQPGRLLSRELAIGLASIESVEMRRTPQTPPRPKTDSSLPDFGFRLDEARIDEFRTSDGVFGPAASYRIAGSAARSRDNDGKLDLDVMPLSGPGDRVQASANWTGKGVFKALAEADGPEGGALSALLQSPAGAAVKLDADLTGEWPRVEGKARLLFGDRTVIMVDGRREDQMAVVTGRMSLADWPLAEPVAKMTGDDIAFEARSDFDNGDAQTSITVDAPAGHLEVGGNISISERRLNTPLDVKAERIDLARIIPNHTGLANANGKLAFNGLDGWSFEGLVAAADFDFPGGFTEEVSGPVAVSQSDGAIAWAIEKAEARGATIDALPKLDAAPYTVSTRGTYNLRSRLVDVTAAQVTGAAGSATARGQYHVGTGEMEFGGSAALAKLSEFGPLSGSARGTWSVSQRASGGALRIGADVTGSSVRSTVDVLDQVAGRTPHVVLSGVWRNGRFLIESGSIDGGAIAARVNGRIDEGGAVSVSANGSIRRPLTISGVAISRAAFNGGMTGTITHPNIRLSLNGGEVSAAGTDITDVAGTASLTLNSATSGRFDLTGNSLGQPASASGRIEGRSGVWSLLDGEAKLASMTATVPRLSWSEEDGAKGAFTLNGSMAGLAGFSQGAVTGQGTFDSAGPNGVLADWKSQITDVRYGDLRFRQVSLNAQADGLAAAFQSRIVGLSPDQLDATVAVDALREDGLWTGDARFSGRFAGEPIATPQPVAWTFGEGGWSVDGAVQALGGALTAQALSGADDHRARLELSNIQLEPLTTLMRFNPMSGRISGNLTFSNAPGAPATGDLTATLTDANPVGVTSDPVTVALSAQLRGDTLSARASGSGQGFLLESSGRAFVNEGDGFGITPATDAPLTAAVKLDGRAEQLWALFGPQGQALRGRLTAEVDVSGTMASPALDGGFSMSEGVYDHGESGLRLQNISTTGEFDTRSLRITRLTASDGRNGRLSGDGQFDWSGEQLAGAVEFSANDLEALGRSDRSATLSGNGSLELAPDAVLVKGDFTISQARISIEQPASASVPTLSNVRYVNFPQREAVETTVRTPARPVRLDLQIGAPRRIVVFGRGLDTEWGADFNVSGAVDNPIIRGEANLVRGSLNLGGRSFDFNTGTIQLNGPIRSARVNITAERDADDIDAQVNVSGSPTNPEFTLTSTPSLPQDEILSRVLFGRSASQLTALEAAQLAAALAQLAGGQAGFDPAGLLRDATGLDRVSIGASGGVAVVSAGKYIADDVYLEVGAGGQGGVGAEVEWEPTDEVSVISSAQGNGDTKIRLRWKKDY
jgi:translocation and assembly module TamB